MSLRFPFRRVTIAALSAFALAAPATAHAVPAKFWGISPVEATNSQEFELMRKGGVGTYRMVMFWRDVEPEAPTIFGPAHSYDWSGIDSIMAHASANRIKVYPHVLGSPRWVEQDPRVPPLDSPEARSAWRDFLTAAVQRYGYDGTFWALHPELPYNPIKDWQIWNEQNSSVRYLPKVDPVGYADLVRLSSDAIRSVNGRARIVLGGMFGTPGTPNSMTAWKFLKKLYKQPGTREAFDAVAAHPYSPNIRGVRYQIQRLRKKMAKAGDEGKQLDITELTWSSGRHGSDLFVGRRGQARKLDKAFTLLLEKKKEWKIKRVLWTAFKDPDPPTSDCDICKKAGLLNKRLKPKPSWHAYRYYTGAVKKKPRFLR